MEINNIIRNLLIRYPLFGNVIVNLQFKFTNESVPASAFTNGRCIFYKQEFIDDYFDDEKEFIVAHEIFHIVLSHLFRNVGRDRDLLNYVEDAIINQLLVKDGLTMPEGLVDIPDALDYSTEELYMKYLPQLKQIKEWMNANTYHMEISDLEEWVNEVYNQDLQDLMGENSHLRNELLGDFQEELKKQAQFGNMSLGIEFPSVSVERAAPLIYWKELLRANIVTPDEVTTAFYEVEIDGIIKKEEKQDISYAESEIIIDSSGSMSMQKIKAILRECKNILSASQIKVGFCDIEFYGWNEIRNDSDIDNLHIKGRGFTDFTAMAESFSKDADNKIVITDGEGFFPKNCSDVLWIIMNYYLPIELFGNSSRKDINYIFINEKDIHVPIDSKELILERKPYINKAKSFLNIF